MEIESHIIPNLLRIARNPEACSVQRTNAFRSLERHRSDERVSEFFAAIAERERVAQLRQRALNLKKRPIK